MKVLIILIGLTMSAYFLIAALLFVFQRDFLYFPTENYAHTLAVEQFPNANERVEIIVLNESKENAVLYFGGNGESMLHSSSGLADAFPAHTLYLVNYRGYGGSSGKPTEKALYSDAQYIYDVLAKRHVNLSVIGRSLGSGIATFLAATRTIDKIILITPYDSIQRIAQDKFPFLPMSILLQD